MNLTYLPERHRNERRRTLDESLEEWLLTQERLLSRWLQHTSETPSPFDESPRHG